MRKRGGGVIVNVSPVQAFGTRQGVATYAAREDGINALTRAMAVDQAPVGIRVVVIRPAPVETAMCRAFSDRFNGERRREAILADRGQMPPGPDRSTRGARRPDRLSGRSPCRLHHRRRQHDRRRSSLHPPRGAPRGRLTGRAPRPAGMPILRRSNNFPAPGGDQASSLRGVPEPGPESARPVWPSTMSAGTVQSASSRSLSLAHGPRERAGSDEVT